MQNQMITFVPMIKSMQQPGVFMSFINQYSFLIVAVAAVLILGFFLFRKRVEGSNFVTLGALILGLVFAFLLLRPKLIPSQDVEGVVTQIGSGQPVLIQFQSEY